MRRALSALDHLGSRPWFADATLLAACVAVLAAALVLSPDTEVVTLFGFEVPVLCSFRRLTGWPCPGCGLTRSFTFLAHGRVAEGFAMNWFGPPLFLLLVAQLPFRGWRIWRRARG